MLADNQIRTLSMPNVPTTTTAANAQTNPAGGIPGTGTGSQAGSVRRVPVPTGYNAIPTQLMHRPHSYDNIQLADDDGSTTAFDLSSGTVTEADLDDMDWHRRLHSSSIAQQELVMGLTPLAFDGHEASDAEKGFANVHRSPQLQQQAPTAIMASQTRYSPQTARAATQSSPTGSASGPASSQQTRGSRTAPQPATPSTAAQRPASLQQHHSYHSQHSHSHSHPQQPTQQPSPPVSSSSGDIPNPSHQASIRRPKQVPSVAHALSLQSIANRQMYYHTGAIVGTNGSPRMQQPGSDSYTTSSPSPTFKKPIHAGSGQLRR